MDQTKGINAISYLSYFFAPLLVPIVIYFASKNVDTRSHAKRALISHIILIMIGIVLFGLLFFMLGSADPTDHTASITYMLAFGGYLVFCFALAIWNVVQAIKVLR